MEPQKSVIFPLQPWLYHKHDFVSLATPCWLKAIIIVLKTYGSRLIFFMRLDGRKTIQLLKPAWSICIQSLNPTSYPLLREITVNIKRNHWLNIHTYSMNMKFNILFRIWKCKLLHTIWQSKKYKLPKMGSKMTLFIHLNKSFGGILDF